MKRILHHYNDRLLTSALHLGPLGLTWTRRPFAYSLYVFGHRLAWKSIDYAKAPN